MIRPRTLALVALALAACGGPAHPSAGGSSGGGSSGGGSSGDCTAAAGATLSSGDALKAGKCACLAWESDTWLISFDAQGTLGKDGKSTGWEVSCQTNSTSAKGFMNAAAHQVTYSISGGAAPHLVGSSDNAIIGGCNASTAALVAADSTTVVPGAYGRFAAMAGFDAPSAKLADGAKSDCGTMNGALIDPQAWVVTAQWNVSGGVKVAGATYAADGTFQKSYGPCDASDVNCIIGG